MGKGAIIYVSRKKMSTKISKEAELLVTDDASSLILRTKIYLETQGFKAETNILYQDNKSTILLQENSKKCSSKRTRHLNIRYFSLTDQPEKENLTIKYLLTDAMISEFMSKPLQGEKSGNTETIFWILSKENNGCKIYAHMLYYMNKCLIDVNLM